MNGAAAIPPITDSKALTKAAAVKVKSRMGAVAWGNLPTLRFPSPLIKPDVPNYGIRLSD